MAETKAEQPKEKKKEKKLVAPDEDTRYRYIGFEVFPKKERKFWKSEKEIERHLEKVRSVKVFSDWDRDFSLVHEPDITKPDKIVLTIANLVLLASMFLPWMSYRTAAGLQGGNWFSVWSVLGGILNGAFASSTAVGVAAIFGLVVLTCTPLMAILTLIPLYAKGKNPESAARRLRRILQLNYLPLAAWVGGFICSLVGGDIGPVTRAGILYGGENYTIVTVFSLISYGMVLTVAVFYVNAFKSNDM